MSIIGKVDSLWRYPVKSMGGEKLTEAFVGFAGIYGDRIFAFKSSARPKGFPYLTAREQRAMLRYRPQFRHPDKALQPPNLSEAEKLGPGVTPLYADLTELSVDVVTAAGEHLAIDDPVLIDRLSEGIDAIHGLTLLRSARALTDCRPISLFSLQTAAQLATEVGTDVDPRRFRANIYANFPSISGFAEDAWVGRSLRIGSQVVITITGRDPRCKMISLDPDTGEANVQILRQVVQAHAGMAGIYCAVLVEGMIGKGDAIDLLD